MRGTKLCGVEFDKREWIRKRNSARIVVLKDVGCVTVERRMD